ncbi:hypothetical protein K449DRAFT_429760 [Hypoxylon sp. EC38]|nr:hypothetical protein K449DRAFT_429760 [Hypoxylon sp. EC38]
MALLIYRSRSGQLQLLHPYSALKSYGNQVFGIPPTSTTPLALSCTTYLKNHFGNPCFDVSDRGWLTRRPWRHDLWILRGVPVIGTRASYLRYRECGLTDSVLFIDLNEQSFGVSGYLIVAWKTYFSGAVHPKNFKQWREAIHLIGGVLPSGVPVQKKLYQSNCIRPIAKADPTRGTVWMYRRYFAGAQVPMVFDQVDECPDFAAATISTAA